MNKPKKSTRGGTRDGAGRPRLEEAKKQICLRIDKKIYENILHHASSMGQRPSSYAASVISSTENEYYLRTKKKQL